MESEWPEMKRKPYIFCVEEKIVALKERESVY